MITDFDGGKGNKNPKKQEEEEEEKGGIEIGK